MEFLEILKILFLGIVEGITEWLPISSTGHLVLFNHFIPLNLSPDFIDMFEYVIQLAAILAVVVIFWKRICPISIQKSGAADKKQAALLDAQSICRDILEKDVSVDVGKQDIIRVALKQGSISAICLYHFTYTIQTGIIIRRNRRYSIDVDSIYM